MLKFDAGVDQGYEKVLLLHFQLFARRVLGRRPPGPVLKKRSAAAAAAAAAAYASSSDESESDGEGDCDSAFGGSTDRSFADIDLDDFSSQSSQSTVGTRAARWRGQAPQSPRGRADAEALDDTFYDYEGNPCDSEGNPVEIEYEDEDGNPCDSEGNPLPVVPPLSPVALFVRPPPPPKAPRLQPQQPQQPQEHQKVSLGVANKGRNAAFDFSM